MKISFFCIAASVPFCPSPQDGEPIYAWVWVAETEHKEIQERGFLRSLCVCLCLSWDRASQPGRQIHPSFAQAKYSHVDRWWCGLVPPPPKLGPMWSSGLVLRWLPQAATSTRVFLAHQLKQARMCLSTQAGRHAPGAMQTDPLRQNSNLSILFEFQKQESDIYRLILLVLYL